MTPPAGPGDQQPASSAPSLRVLLLAMASLVLLLGAVFGRHGLLEARQYRLERDRLQAEILLLEKRNAELEQEIKALRTDPSAVERIAREELGLARPGERLVLLAPPQRHDEPVAATVPGLDAVLTAP